MTSTKDSVHVRPFRSKVLRHPVSAPRLQHHGRQLGAAATHAGEAARGGVGLCRKFTAVHFPWGENCLGIRCNWLLLLLLGFEIFDSLVVILGWNLISDHASRCLCDGAP